MQFDKNEIISFYDELSRILTDYETDENTNGEDLYDFLVDLHTKLAHKLN